jgi:hypothetical protein
MSQLASGILMAALFASPVLGQQQPYQPKYAGDAAHSEPEFIALAYMRTVLNAERLYNKKHAKYTTSLAQLAGSGSFTRRMVKTDRGDYTVSFHASHNGYTLQLTPKSFDAQHRAFWMNENGIFRVEESQPATAESPLLKPD